MKPLPGALFKKAALAAAFCLAPAARATGAPPPCPDCNIILLSIDTLRADAVSAYGYGRPTTPNLDRLAAGGVLFSDFFSNAPNTYPSHMSILTGLYPWRHGCEIDKRGDRLAADATTLAEALTALGYRTVWAANPLIPWLRLDSGFGRGFQETAPSPLARQRFRRDELAHIPAWLRANQGRKFFLFAHYREIHVPYFPSREAIKRLAPLPEDYERLFSREAVEKRIRGKTGPWNRSTLDKWNGQIVDEFMRAFDRRNPEHKKAKRLLYDASVYEADLELGLLLEELRRLGLDRNTVVAVTSDHGEAFYEHGRWGHYDLHAEVTRVPLVISAPGLPAGLRSAETAQSVDIAQTLLHLVSGTGLPDPDGVSLLPRLLGLGPVNHSRPALAKWGTGHSVRDSRYALIRRDVCRRLPRSWNPECFRNSLYDRAGDPYEQADIAGENPGETARLKALLGDAEKAGESMDSREWPEGVPASIKRNLMDFGYW